MRNSIILMLLAIFWGSLATIDDAYLIAAIFLAASFITATISDAANKIVTAIYPKEPHDG